MVLDHLIKDLVREGKSKKVCYCQNYTSNLKAIFVNTKKKNSWTAVSAFGNDIASSQE